jgi:DNA-binding MarR family transcriptional regulator
MRQASGNDSQVNSNIAKAAARLEQMERDLNGIRRAMRKPLEALEAAENVTLPQRAVLQVVVRKRGISLKDLSREVNLAHSTVSGIVDRMEKRGMVKRRADPEDGRMARIYPTAAVDAFVRERVPALARGPLETALKRASTREREEISRALKRLRELLENV